MDRFCIGVMNWDSTRNRFVLDGCGLSLDIRVVWRSWLLPFSPWRFDSDLVFLRGFGSVQFGCLMLIIYFFAGYWMVNFGRRRLLVSFTKIGPLMLKNSVFHSLFFCRFIFGIFSPLSDECAVCFIVLILGLGFVKKRQKFSSLRRNERESRMTLNLDDRLYLDWDLFFWIFIN